MVNSGLDFSLEFQVKTWVKTTRFFFKIGLEFGLDFLKVLSQVLTRNSRPKSGRESLLKTWFGHVWCWIPMLVKYFKSHFINVQPPTRRGERYSGTSSNISSMTQPLGLSLVEKKVLTRQCSTRRSARRPSGEIWI